MHFVSKRVYFFFSACLFVSFFFPRVYSCLSSVRSTYGQLAYSNLSISPMVLKQLGHREAFLGPLAWLEPLASMMKILMFFVVMLLELAGHDSSTSSWWPHKMIHLLQPGSGFARSCSSSKCLWYELDVLDLNTSSVQHHTVDGTISCTL